jgi:hypothetical protein
VKCFRPLFNESMQTNEGDVQWMLA